MLKLAATGTYSRREFISGFAIVPAAAIWIRPGSWWSTRSYEIWKDKLCSFVGRYSSSFTFSGGGVLACREGRIPKAVQISAVVDDPSLAAEAFRAAPFDCMSIYADRIFFRHLNSLIMLDHSSNSSSLPDFQHQLLRLNPSTGFFSDPYSIWSQHFASLCLICNPSDLGTGFQIYLSGLLELSMYGLIPSESFIKLEGDILRSRVRTDKEALDIYSALVAGLASLIGHIRDEDVKLLFHSSLIGSTLKQLGAFPDMISARERLLSVHLVSSKSRGMSYLAALLAAFPQTETSALQNSRRFPVSPALNAVAQAAKLSRISNPNLTLYHHG